MIETSELNDIREELHTLRLLYKKIAEQHIPIEDPTQEDLEALECTEETIDLDNILTTLGKQRTG
jgi:archaellum component FlaC